MATYTASTQLALSAVRGQMRYRHIDPLECDADMALQVIDDLARQKPNLLVSIWYNRATDKQFRAFRRAWDKWLESESDCNFCLQLTGAPATASAKAKKAKQT